MSSQGPVVVVGVLILSFLIWLWCYSPQSAVSELEAWLDDSKLSLLKQHPMIQGTCTSATQQSPCYLY